LSQKSPISIQVYLPPALQNLVDGCRPVTVEAGTVEECLDHLVLRYPRLKKALWDAPGVLNPRLSFFINTENAYPGVLAKKLINDDKLYIMNILSGG
jgi:hypothetical protein